MKKIKIIRIFISFLFLLSIVLTCCTYPFREGNVYLKNDMIRLGFDRETGAFRVLTDLTSSYEFLDENSNPGSPWEIDIITDSVTKTIDITDHSKITFIKRSSRSLRITWSDFKGIENKNLKVTTRISLDKNEALSFWKISIEGTSGMKISRVGFPNINGLKNQVNEYLAVPAWMGQLMKDPRNYLAKMRSKEKKYEFVYPGKLSLQCLALYDPQKCGLYTSCNDSLAYYKTFGFSLDSLKNLTYLMNNYPSLDPNLDSYTTPYEAIIGSFKGDWITAAERYREWGTKQRWCAESRFKTKSLPPWLENTAIWVWNRGKSANVLEPAKDMKRRLGLPVSVHWHWWHRNPYDQELPEYFPPREGKNSFVRAISDAQDAGIRSFIYMNCVCWGNSTESWKNENAEYYSVKDISGKTISRVYNIFTRKSLSLMCMDTRFWQDKYSALCDSAVNTYQTNGVYMDMACVSAMCYDRNHGHSIGGGNYWVKGFGELTRQIRSKVSQNNQPVFTGEGGGEAWLPYLDAFLTLQVSMERYSGITGWEPIPFFQAVYHQYAISYGSYSSLLIPPYDELWPKEFAPTEPLALLDKNLNKQFLMEQARSFVWGMQPTIANYQSFLASERKEETEYLINLAKVRYQGLKYLLYGKFLRTPEITIPEEEFDISKLSIYAGRREESVTISRKSFPLIYTGTWKADDNQLGIAMASISDEPFRISFSFNSKDYELLKSGKIYIIGADGKKLLNSYSDGNISIDFTLQPRGLCIFEITPDD